MTDKHLSSQFDADLNTVSTRVLEMGGLVESQLHQALYALVHLSLETANQVIENEARVNQMEREIDHDITSTIARRQPMAVDLRELVGAIHIAGDLERTGDLAKNIAKRWPLSCVPRSIGSYYIALGQK